MTVSVRSRCCDLAGGGRDRLFVDPPGPDNPQNVTRVPELVKIIG